MPKREPKVSPASGLDVLHLLDLSFRDYEGARCLLLNDLLFPGAQLASLAVEKYAKLVLAISGATSKFHLDDLSQAKKVCDDQGVPVLNEMDPQFLSLLSAAFRLRYYDADTGPEPFGFFKWQLLGELDATVARIEGQIEINGDGKGVLSPYARAAFERRRTVWWENHVLNGWAKPAFMERAGPFLFRMFMPNGREMLKQLDQKPVPYQGAMVILTNLEIVDAPDAVRVAFEEPYKASFARGAQPPG